MSVGFMLTCNRCYAEKGVALLIEQVGFYYSLHIYVLRLSTDSFVKG